MASINVIQGPDKGSVYEIPLEGCVIGRGSDTLKLHDPAMSRTNSRIYPKNHSLYIEDMQSANGTFINGTAIKVPTELKPGDHIRIGKTVLVFSEEEGMELPLDETEFGEMIDLDVSGEMVDSAIMSALPSEPQVLLAPEEPHYANKHLRTLYDLVVAAASIVDINQLLEKVMELIFRELRVDRGFILLVNEKAKTLEPVVVKHRKQANSSGKKQITTSNTIIRRVVKSHEGVLCSNAMTDNRFSKGESIQGFGINSVICVPILARNKILGIIHIDCSTVNFSYSREQLHLLTAIGFQSGLAISNIQLFHESIRAERLAATGQTVTSLSHYIKNILQGLQGGADTVELGIRSPSVKIIETGWRIVNRNLGKIQNLMLNMLALGKEREPRLEMTQINSIVQEVEELIQKTADDKGIMIINDLSSDMPAIPIDPDGLYRVILNILNNAMDAVPDHSGAITIRTHFEEENNQTIISIGDNGRGIPEDEIDKVFEVFHSTKGNAGTGLGLAVSYKIIKEHNGDISVESIEGEGAIFSITLPCEQEGGQSSDTTGGMSETM